MQIAFYEQSRFIPRPKGQLFPFLDCYGSVSDLNDR